MKITRRDLGVIMILVGILAIFLTYQVYFTDMQTQVEALQTEQKSLKSQITELQPVVDSAEFYQDEMERFQEEVEDMMDEYPVNVIYEDGIMYIVGLTDELDVQIPSLTVSEATVSNSVEGTGILEGKTYQLLKATETMTYTAADYDTVKELLDYIYADENSKKTITSVSMTFDSTSGEIAGSLNISVFAMTDGTRTYEEVDLPLDSLGIDCIFGEVTETEEADED